MEKVAVAIQRGKNPKETVKRTLQLLGGLGKVIKNGDTVLLSPNYGVPMSPETGATTDPEVAGGVIEAARQAGGKKIIVAESSVVGFNAGEVMAELGVNKMFESAGAEVLNLDEDQKNVIQKKVPRVGIYVNFCI